MNMLWFKKKEQDIKIDENTVRWRIRFFGKVQNVGFRFTASQLAKELKLTGWVHNEEDGSVTLEVQGTKEKMDKIIDELYHDSYIRIEDYKIEEQPVIPNERQFIYHY